MGRIGKRILEIPKGVEIKVAPDGQISAKGPKGTISFLVKPVVKIEIKEGKLTTVLASGDRQAMAIQGLYNSMIENMIVGVTKGFEKELDLVGVGYRATMQGKKLQLQLGYSHPVEFDPPAGIDFEVQGGTRVKVKGIDAQKVGQIASEIRLTRKVEPYKGKGIRYVGEIVRRKAGKAAKATSGGK
ncbi:50S ribosomal protein L6 [candidate division WOR-1 bacterium RIFOXYA12_FULL_52_29]|uniref:Large ribosomal subunit protein uL6 n=1 Tax=candidate division WOR-1 bacterium RIFOXYC12_FULL_54_18 TaxID=1802584 RepID=A0A1F4T7C3_UNCSA|nr:MAG: 50S ribosomal protein L6 [candidate division WOR-1 bacterium RIFOXYA2_FULL_51_19]OGC17576.1 MAG: 50S ribosomal protein L6 [candidate division WOR-1 bacterium RIFOXYA12_FULL_52_29]OGC26433.1 MAG: 50S ribosomal protein L6 [candidate division WOR-1 bacterium RIFOXYB2_FULL_45_9]OGC27993.1 MAG: 50S ribosomal protein L6 [candidate division WOR-1 bacterium RIFOXYC12_FULL_54_18]OGC29721.1 MAG: 50S ribosomal protein L6 [candidate division WOR-1 bacterium RIFOXYB12_FULL_52_16]